MIMQYQGDQSEAQMVDVESNFRDVAKEFERIIFIEGTRITPDEDGDNMELFTVTVNNRYGESEISHSQAFRQLGLNHHSIRLLPYWSAMAQLKKYCRFTRTPYPKYKVVEEKDKPEGEEFEKLLADYKKSEESEYQKRKDKAEEKAWEQWEKDQRMGGNGNEVFERPLTVPARYLAKHTQPPLYKFINLPFRPELVTIKSEIDGKYVETTGFDISDATEKAASALIRILGQKYSRFSYLNFNFADKQKPLNIAQLEDFTKKNHLMRHFEYKFPSSPSSENTKNSENTQIQPNSPQEVTCKISLSCSDENNEKTAAKILLNFQQIAANRAEMLKESYTEPNWSYIAHQSTAVYRINRAYAPLGMVQANTWKIDGGLEEKTEEQIRAEENTWHKESNRANPFEDCSPIQVYPSFPITTLADWARENGMKPRPKYSQDVVDEVKDGGAEKDEKTTENEGNTENARNSEISDNFDTIWYQYKCIFVKTETIGIAKTKKEAKQIAAKRMLNKIRVKMNLPKSAYAIHAKAHALKRQEFFCSTEIFQDDLHEKQKSLYDNGPSQDNEPTPLVLFDLGLNSQFGGYESHATVTGDVFYDGNPAENPVQRLNNCGNWLKLKHTWDEPEGCDVYGNYKVSVILEPWQNTSQKIDFNEDARCRVSLVVTENMVQQKEVFTCSGKTKRMAKKMVALEAWEHLEKLFDNFREEFDRVEVIKLEEQTEIKKHKHLMKKKQMQQNFNQNTSYNNHKSFGGNSPTANFSAQPEFDTNQTGTFVNRGNFGNRGGYRGNNNNRGGFNNRGDFGNRGGFGNRGNFGNRGGFVQRGNNSFGNRGNFGNRGGAGGGFGGGFQNRGGFRGRGGFDGGRGGFDGGRGGFDAGRGGFNRGGLNQGNSHFGGGFIQF